MRCKICNSVMNNPTWNSELNDWEVCGTCLDAIFDTFEDHTENEDEEADYDDLSDIDPDRLNSGGHYSSAEYSGTELSEPDV